MRPKNESTSLLEQAQQYGPEAIATLVGIAQNSSNPSAKLAAIKTLLGRGFGKPPHYRQRLRIRRNRADFNSASTNPAVY